MRKNISEEEFMNRLEKMRELYLEKQEKLEESDKADRYRGNFLDFFSSEEARKIKMKRRMAQLEFKRCQRLNDKKSCTDIDKKMAETRAMYRRKFMDMNKTK